MAISFHLAGEEEYADDENVEQAAEEGHCGGALSMVEAARAEDGNRREVDLLEEKSRSKGWGGGGVEWGGLMRV